MKKYSINSNVRTWHLATIITLAFILWFPVNEYWQQFISYSQNSLTILNNPAIDTILVVLAGTPVGLFIAIYYLHDWYIWKLFPDKFGITKISGKWIGYIDERTDYASVQDAPATIHEAALTVTMDVKQSFNNMAIFFNVIKNSSSETNRPTRAQIIGFNKEQSTGSKLMFTWERGDLSGKSELDLKFSSFLNNTRNRNELMVGEYISSHPTIGQLTLKKVRKLDRHFCGEIVARSSNQNGNKFLAVEIQSQFITQFIKTLKTIEKKSFTMLDQNRHARDGIPYHITIVTSKEYKSKEHDKLVGRSFWFDLGKLGYMQVNDCETYYIICESEKVQTVRKECGLGEIDLHVTMGFNPHDIHDVSKGVHTTMTFSQKLKKFLHNAK